MKAVADREPACREWLRPAQPGDAAGLAVIDNLVNPGPWSRSRFEMICGGSAEVALVAGGAGEVWGFVIFSQVLDEACIQNIAVHPQRQGAGLGRALLQAALQEMEQRGVSCCQLEVRRSNAVARGLYAAAGFHQDGLRRNYYSAAEGREDALLLSREV